MFPRRGIVLITLLLALSVAFSHPTLAATLLVPEDFSLDDALTSTVPGDTVSVAGGTVSEAAVRLPPGIVLLSRSSQGNTLAQLLAWNLETPSTVQGFHFALPDRWDLTSPSWLGVIVDHSRVTFIDCQFSRWLGISRSRRSAALSTGFRQWIGCELEIVQIPLQ